MSAAQIILVATVAAPGLAFGGLGLLWLLGWAPPERALARITRGVFSASLSGVIVLIARAGVRPAPVMVNAGAWISVGGYKFPLTLRADGIGLAFLALTAALSGLIGHFSTTYLHREPGFFRFFLLLHLFAFGALLAFAAGSFDLLAVGWEFIGITSVLLIGFFQHRPAPVENGLRVFGIYRAADLGLIAGLVAMHHWAGAAPIGTVFAGVAGMPAFIIAVCLLLAAAGKAAQVPFSGWLPRAMEGPTPSSAIFYGAISIHAGAYLLLRAQPLLAHSRPAAAMVLLTGLATALQGTIAGRASADAKTSLAYATLTQVGVIFIEIGLGWTRLALLHIMGNALVRTWQFLRTPSALHDEHRIRAALGHEDRSAALPGLRLPEPMRLWLYRWALDRGHLDTVLDRCVVEPLFRASAFLARLDALGATAAARWTAPAQEDD